LKGLAWHDDSQIARYGQVEKLYVENNPRTELRISAIDNHP
jgi:Holliday junction resolvase RusA-like endonuclease